MGKPTWKFVNRQAFSLFTQVVLILSFLLSWPGSVIADSKSFSKDKTHILILHSYHRGMLWVDSISQGLDSELPFSVDRIVHFEYLDAKRHPSAAHRQNVAELFSQKFAGVNFSVIITSDDIAFNFAIEHRKKLFNNAPVVFCGVNFFNPELYKTETNFTGVVERNDLLKTMNLAFSLHPKAKNVFIINDTTSTGKANLEAIEKLRPFLPSDRNLHFSGSLPMEELKSKIASLSDDYVILLLSYNLDAFGQYFPYRELGKNVAEVAKVPVYCVWDFFFDGCATGGCITRGFDQGSAAGKLAKRILAGEKASAIPVQSRYITKYMFDYNKLKQYQIPESKLPDGSIILNQPYSFYRENTALFWQIAIVFLLFIILSLGLILSILKLLKSQKELEEGRQSLKITLDSIAEGVIATDQDGRVTRMNPIAEKILDFNLKEAKGKFLSQVLCLKAENSDEICNSLEKQILEAGENSLNLSRFNILIRRNNNQLPVSCTASPIRDEFGEISGIVVVFRDMTEEKLIQEKLRRSQKMDAIGQLAGGVAHDFNNALSGIIGAVQLLQKENSTELSGKMLKIIEKSADRAADLTAKLLAFSRKSNVEMVPQNFHGVVQAATDILARTIDRRIILKNNFNACSFNVSGNFSELENVLLNLGINASHAMPEGGSLTFTTSNINLTKEYCESSTFNIKPGEYLLLEVADTGVGIPPENLNRIFEPFFTTKELGKGTGLGLSAAFGSVVQHHGAINAYSEPGRGTIFRIYLPIINASAGNQEEKHEITPGSGTILLIDDEPAIRFANGLLLESAGYKVLLAEDGISGLETLKKNLAEIDLILLDMIMPKMNGSECFKRIIEIKPEVKVILCSGFPQDADLAEMKKQGLTSFLCKPCRADELTRKVAEAIGLKQQNIDSQQP